MVESQLVVVGNQLLVVTVVGVDHRERERGEKTMAAEVAVFLPDKPPNVTVFLLPRHFHSSLKDSY